MQANKFIAADEAAALIADGATVGLVGGGGGLMEASTVFAAIERRFLATRHPADLTLVHALGIGDRKSMGLNRFAHEGMVRRVIGGHWVWSPRMQELARAEKIEAYVLPAGVIMQLYREIGAGRPGLVSPVGLGTFVDPRQDGGRMNAAAKASLVDVVNIDDQEWLRYKSFPIDVAIIRGTFADPQGNVSLVGEAANLDIHAIALAAHNSGGKVIAQVRHAVEAHSLPARQVNVPGVLIDAVVVDPDQRTGYDVAVDPALSGERRGIAPREPPQPFTARQVIARRAAEELVDGAVVNYGYGIPDGVAKLVAMRGHGDRYYQSIEHGAYGGTLLEGSLFGYARNPSAIIDAPSQFDFYSGGGLDIAFLGFGQIDAEGNVNVSKLAGSAGRSRGIHRHRAERAQGRLLRHVRHQGHAHRDRRRQPRHRAPRRRAQARAARRPDHVFRGAGAAAGAGDRLCHRARGVPADRRRRGACRGRARRRPCDATCSSGWISGR